MVSALSGYCDWARSSGSILHLRLTWKFPGTRDVRHKNPYLGSQTLGSSLTENRAHNGSIQAGGENRSDWHHVGPKPRHFHPGRASGTKFRFASGNKGMRNTTTLLYPKRLPPMVATRVCSSRCAGISLSLQANFIDRSEGHEVAEPFSKKLLHRVGHKSQ